MVTDTGTEPVDERGIVKRRTGPAVVLSCGNQKGGVGKTTTCVSLATALARDYAVLAVDLDHQGQLGDDLGVVLTRDDKTIGEWLISEEGDPDRYSQQTSEDADRYILHSVLGVDLLAARANTLTQASLAIQGDNIAGLQRLRFLLETVRDRYDFIIIDLPAGFEALATLGLATLDVVLPVMTPDYAAWISCVRFIARAGKVRGAHNPSMLIGPIIRNGYNVTQSPPAQQREVDVAVASSEYEVWPTIIPRSEYISKARREMMPAERLFENQLAVHTYRQLAKDLVAWCDTKGI